MRAMTSLAIAIGVAALALGCGPTYVRGSPWSPRFCLPSSSCSSRPSASMAPAESYITQRHT